MCGIFGSEFGGRVAPALEAMKYRGPDEQIVRRVGKFSLGLARLAIIDTERPDAAQPFLSAKGTLTAFNGEIYNYRSLDPRATEVKLLSEMIDEGFDVRQYVDGDYAIAHFNPSQSRLTLYRDRFGVCPLYYQLRPWVEVSSEARRLRAPKEVPAHGRVVIDVRRRRLIVRDILPLYGATSEPPNCSFLADLLIDAVTSRALHADSPYSLALSGGLDSSVIALALVRSGVKPRPLCLVTAFSESSEDLLYARRLADKLRLPLQVLMIPEVLEECEASDVLLHLDAPRSQVNAMRYRGALRSWFVAKASSTRVILSGDGGDELLGGYPCHHAVATQASGRAYPTTRKRLSTLKSMQHFNLDRTNKMGMAHSKEFRAPLLASTLSQALIAQRWGAKKPALRELASLFGAPEIAAREYKYSTDELRVTSLPLMKGDAHEQLKRESGGSATGRSATPAAQSSSGIEWPCAHCTTASMCRLEKVCAHAANKGRHPV